ncbi:hypothetical protein ACFQGE_03260 [Halomicroarcula sp. GCM10025817]|uniref:hypothetical protein n=1 Tax=Haloarcula TaxID=2237 RepID=UPI0023E8BC99|nr:hypothetical protein [Halomicroarcula sp. SYNS111]
MSAGRRVALVGLGLSLALAVTQTGAFTATIADRGVDVDIGDDQSAYLGVQEHAVSVPGNVTTRATLATVTNRFGSALDVSVSVDGAEHTPPTLSSVRGPGTLSTGERGAVVADVSCDDSAAVEPVDVVVEGTGPDVGVELTRSVTVTCEAVVETGSAETTATATATATSSPTESG